MEGFQNNRKGLTLTEILVVIALIGLIASMIVPRIMIPERGEPLEEGILIEEGRNII